MNIKKHIPNILTCCNLLCGMFGIVVILSPVNVFSDSWTSLIIFIIFAAIVFDFLDGLAARLLNVSSSIGKELDSLADMVSFGVLPGLILYQMLLWKLGILFYANEYDSSVINAFLSEYNLIIPYFGFLIPVFSALRLAKFNIDIRQADSFIGLPTPANTFFISGLVYIFGQEENVFGFLVNPVSLIVLCIILSFLLVLELPLIALKFKTFAWKDNKTRYLLIISAISLFSLLNFTAIPIIVILYIILSMIENRFLKNQSV